MVKSSELLRWKVLEVQPGLFEVWYSDGNLPDDQTLFGGNNGAPYIKQVPMEKVLWYIQRMKDNYKDGRWAGLPLTFIFTFLPGEE